MNFSNGILYFKTLEFNPTIYYLKKDNKKFFYPMQRFETDVGAVWRGRMHPCSPIFGSPEGKGIYSKAPQHGELRDLPWIMESYDQTSGGEYSLIYDKWGTEIEYRVRFRMIKNWLQVFTAMTNRKSQPVPIELGWHPYFNAPNGGTVRFVGSDIPFIEINKAYDSKIFPAPDHVSIGLNGIGIVKMVFYEGFDSGKVCVWTDWLQNYFCVEPLISYRDVFNTKKGVYLKPKETYIANFAMYFK